MAKVFCNQWGIIREYAVARGEGEHGVEWMFYDCLTHLSLSHISAFGCRLHILELSLNTHRHRGVGGHADPRGVDGGHALDVRVRV